VNTESMLRRGFVSSQRPCTEKLAVLSMCEALVLADMSLMLFTKQGYACNYKSIFSSETSKGITLKILIVSLSNTSLQTP
jgi:hypothetical protein